MNFVEVATIIPLLLHPETAESYGYSRLGGIHFPGVTSAMTINHSSMWIGHFVDDALAAEMGEIADLFPRYQTAPTLLNRPFIPMSEREASIGGLASEISGYVELAKLGDQENAPWDATDAAAQALAMIVAMPEALPLPRVMLLSKQIGVYWDATEMYAEIDFDGSGHIDAYGRHAHRGEVHINHLRITDTTGITSFPIEMEAIIALSAEAAVA